MKRTELEYGKLFPGTRWTVMRPTSPGTRRGTSRRRVVARCSCGKEHTVFVEDLVGGRSAGCRSSDCRARWDAIPMLRAGFEELVTRFLEGGPCSVLRKIRPGT